jgi:DNA processing protein
VPVVLDEELAWIALAQARLGAAWWRSVIAAVGSARALLESSDARLGELGLNAAGVRALRQRAGPETAASVRAECERHAIAIAHYASEAYPALLREIPDPPAVLYFRGPPPAAAALRVAVVGSRRPTRYGRRIAHGIARDLAVAGVTVTSGMAYGIDTCAHEGGLVGGKSAAVLACGLDRPYPRGNRRVFEALVASGGVVSEYPPKTPVSRFNFPARNRIVTGMSRAVVIVEGAPRSGSLLSARLAADQSRDLFAVPGNIDSPMSSGTNGLLRDGCAPLIETADVLEAIGLGHRVQVASEPAAPRVQDPDANRVLAALESEPAHVDELSESSGLDGARVLELLTTLELAGLVERSAGGLFAARQRVIFARERAGPPQRGLIARLKT